MTRKSSTGSLVVVGTGIKLAAQITVEAKQHIENAEKVFFVVADAPVSHWIRELNSSAESLNDLYQSGKPRRETYEDMVESILGPVRDGRRVCAVFYGHPGVYVYPSHRAIARAKGEGYEAWMAPAVSAEDCLYADLGVDPASQGCQSYEATDFLIRKRVIDPHASLILWQIGVIGDQSIRDAGTHNVQGVTELIAALSKHYDANHEVIVYEAAQWAISRASIQKIALSSLNEAAISQLSTLYVPPLPDPPIDEEVRDRLGLVAADE